MNYETESEFVAFVVGGGMGKNILASVPIRGIKKKYPDKKLIVISGYPELHKSHPDVYRSYRMGNIQNFYDDYILDRKTMVLKGEPYDSNDFYYRNKHLSEVWCDQINVPFDNTVPDFYLTPKEDKMAKAFMVGKDKPVLLIQWIGGPGPRRMPDGSVQQPPRMYVRDLHPEILNEVIAAFKKSHHIAVLQTPEQPKLDGVECISAPIRNSLALIKYADKLLMIDSVGQHVAAAFNKPAVVCWSGTSPEVIGHKLHTNLRKKVCDDPECYRPNTFLFDVDETGRLWECPVGEICSEHDPQEIIKALKTVGKSKSKKA